MREELHASEMYGFYHKDICLGCKHRDKLYKDEPCKDCFVRYNIVDVEVTEYEKEDDKINV